MTEQAADKILEEEASPPIKKITAAFNTAAGKWDQEQNLLFYITSFNDAEFKRFNSNQKLGFMRGEFRQMMGQPASQAPLTPAEIEELKQIKAEATAIIGRHKGMNVDAAETLAFAAHAAKVPDVNAFVDNLVNTDGNILGRKPDTLTKAGPFKFDVNSWLYLMKKHGAEHGLGYFADKIEIEEKTDAAGKVVGATVKVEDPAVLREIVAMRDNPRLSSVLGAHVFGEGAPPPINYAGVSYSSDPVILQNQQALLQLGFDIGPKRADGVNGPLSTAATREFMHMRAITDPAQAPQALQDAVEEAKKTAGIYTFNANKKQWERHEATDRKAAATPGAVKIDIKDAFALKVGSERSGIKFNEMLNIVVAQRAFDSGPNPNRQPGLFHMSQGAWLKTLAENGEKYGLGDLVKQMKIERDDQGKVKNVTVPNPMVRKYMLDLRHNPRVSAVMGGERILNGPVHLDIAEAWLGKSENQNKEELQRFFKTFGSIGHNPSSAEAGDASYWCAVFVNTLMDATGRPKTDSLTMARSFVNEGYGTDVVDAADISKAHKGKPAEQKRKMDELAGRVKAGDIVVFPRGDNATFGHVAIVQEIYKDPAGVWRMKVIGGNQGSTDGGGVTVSPDRTLESVVGIRRPPPVSASTLLEKPTTRMASAPQASAPSPG
jgi:hypothetical protein